jgi:SAM-dependent methyltransferase
MQDRAANKTIITSNSLTSWLHAFWQLPHTDDVCSPTVVYKSMPNSSPTAITYLSSPAPVSMGDWWFDIATEDHFWIRRRFKVMQLLADSAVRNSKFIAEIGCGHGLLQKAVEDDYDMPVAGFDLNELALKKNVSRISPLYCYDIHQCYPEFRSYFDLLILFDVLEHIPDERQFLESVKFHLKDSGTLLINVPAHAFFHSDYDLAAGHLRRYSAKQLAKVTEESGFKTRAVTYWGLPLVPLLLARKAIPMQRSNGKAGFDTRGKTINGFLSSLARYEPLPQLFMGTSLMAVLEKQCERV